MGEVEVVGTAMPTRGRLGWALIGASTIAREYMVDAIRGAGDEPLWVVSQNADHAGKFSADCRIPRHTTDLAEALADPGRFTDLVMWLWKGPAIETTLPVPPAIELLG